MNGAAARAASPIGSRPPRRAIVGSSVVTRAAVTPTPTAASEVEGEIPPDGALLATTSKDEPAGSPGTSKQPVRPAR